MASTLERLWTPKPFDPEAFPLTDAGNAERLAARHGHDIRYSVTGRCWYVYPETHWRRDTWNDVSARMVETMRHHQQQATLIGEDDARKRSLQHGLKSEQAPRVGGALEIATGLLPVQEGEFDCDPELLNVVNGTLYVPGGTLGPHRRENYLTKLAGVAYEEGAEAPRFAAFLERILPGEGMVEFLQVLLGCALTGRSSVQLLPIFLGEGANGRSTLFRVLLAVLGDYAMQAPVGLLLEGPRRSAGSATPELLDLKGRRLVAAIETGQGAPLNEPLAKILTGGDRIRARGLYRDPIEFSPSHLCFLVTNHLPAFRGNDHAIQRRMLVIEFPVRIPKEEQRDQEQVVREFVEEEGPGVLNWLLAGYARYAEGGRLPDWPAAVRERTEQFLESCDSVGRFLDECCVLEQGARTRNPILWGAFRAWCERNGVDPGSQTVLTENLERRPGLRRGKSDGHRVIVGLRLRQTLAAVEAA